MSLEIRGKVFGTGIPKICVPISGKEEGKVLAELEEALKSPADLIEWRLDGFYGDLSQTAQKVREAAGDLPILATVRTVQEGGATDLSWNEYTAFYRVLIENQTVDLIDIEYHWGEDLLIDFINEVHQSGIKVVASSHFWDRTPDSGDLLLIYQRMTAVNADMRKIAVTPRNLEDVLRMIRVSLKAQQYDPIRPIISISMGDIGKISRVGAELFGSAVTFGSAAKATAPGQIPAAQLKAFLDTMHME